MHFDPSVQFTICSISGDQLHVGKQPSYKWAIIRVITRPRGGPPLPPCKNHPTVPGKMPSLPVMVPKLSRTGASFGYRGSSGSLCVFVWPQSTHTSKYESVICSCMRLSAGVCSACESTIWGISDRRGCVFLSSARRKERSEV